ncbi:SDR family NAD(P)-dependent oxidoreductase, partial [Aeromicrobium sp. Marseille-Q0843]
GSAVAVAGDVSRTDQIEKLVAAAEESFGPVDIYFANAGVGGGGGPPPPPEGRGPPHPASTAR